MKTKTTKVINLMEDANYVTVRCYAAGVFCGRILRRTGDEIVLADCRRIWQWYGAASLSELSQRGVSQPENCKFPMAVPTITLFGVIEIIPMTMEAKRSIYNVPVWSENTTSTKKK